MNINAPRRAASAPSFVYLIYICIYTCRHDGADIYRAGDVQVYVHEHHVVDVQASAVNEDVGILSEALVGDIAQCVYKTPVCDVARL